MPNYLFVYIFQAISPSYANQILQVFNANMSLYITGGPKKRQLPMNFSQKSDISKRSGKNSLANDWD